MDGILPIILALIAIFAASARKKKRTVSSDETTQGSPWDDLVRELKHLGDEDDQEDSAPTPSVRKSLRQPVNPMDEPESTVFPAPEYQEQPVFSYDDEAIAEQTVSSYEVDFPEMDAFPRITGPITPEVPLQPVIAKAVSEKLPENKVEDNRSGDRKGIFADGFDPREGIIYTEIMKPKYQEY